MSPRTTRNLCLGLIGSGALVLMFVACNSCDDPTNRGHTRSGHYYRRGWGWGGWSSPSYGAGYHSTTPTRSSGSSGHSTSTHSATSRGGFGSSGGHASGGS